MPVTGAKEDNINHCYLFSRVTVTHAYPNKCIFHYLIQWEQSVCQSEQRKLEVYGCRRGKWRKIHEVVVANNSFSNRSRGRGCWKEDWLDALTLDCAWLRIRPGNFESCILLLCESYWFLMYRATLHRSDWSG